MCAQTECFLRSSKFDSEEGLILLTLQHQPRKGGYTRATSLHSDFYTFQSIFQQSLEQYGALRPLLVDMCTVLGQAMKLL